jgi:hypothetical protein
MECISRRDSCTLIERFGTNSPDICGLACLDSLLACDFMRDKRGELLALGDSGKLLRELDPLDDYPNERIVSYGAIAFY